MVSQLESALIIELADSIKWSAALPPLGEPGTLTQIDPALRLDITRYARRDRELQHRDMVNAAAIVKASAHATTVWSGTVVRPTIEGTRGVYDRSGTNISLPLEGALLPVTLPINQGTITYVQLGDLPYTTVQVTDKDLYARDLLIYETLARACAIFPNNPPLIELDPNQAIIGSTSVWPTAEGQDVPIVPNAANPLNVPLFRDPDLYLAERDNQVAAYASRVCQALKNPFEYASRIYVGVTGTQAREPETYVLTENTFLSGQIYAAGEQVATSGTHYQALNTTSDIPPSSNWMGLPEPTLLQFLAEPSLSSRNRIIYDTQGKTLQWFRETLDVVHVPQIVGLYIPGILPGQTIQTVPLIPEQKDAQFYRTKAARVCVATGTWSNEQTVGPLYTSGTMSGSIHTMLQDLKMPTLMTPDKLSVKFDQVVAQAGTYALTCLVRPANTVEIAGGDNLQSSQDPLDNGVDFIPVTGSYFDWQIPLPAGGWQLNLEFSNQGTAATSFFPISLTQSGPDGNRVLARSLPIYYTDAQGDPLPQNTVTDSQAFQIFSAGANYVFRVTWENALPNTGQQFHVSRLRFSSTENRLDSHYIMQGTWQGYGTSVLDVYGQHEMPDIMPFQFYLPSTSTNPVFDIRWVPKTASAWVARPYNTGDQVLFNLVYWQATGPTQATDIPGQSVVWAQLATEPQIPLIFEQVELQKLKATNVTPETAGFEGFRQDMLERALRANQDAYTAHLNQVGTLFPEFRTFGSIWDLHATGSWMAFLEVYAPRVRELPNVHYIVAGHQYEVVGTGHILYNSKLYYNGERFYGVVGMPFYAISGSVVVNQVGAYKLSTPGDLGNTALIPAGLEYNQSAGTLMAWYPSYASFPTHQAMLPWMIEAGFYAASSDFFSPDGNILPPIN